METRKHELSTSKPQVDEQQSLCRSCGICCQGLLFEYVVFEPAEQHPDWPDALIAVASDSAFPLPCRAYQASGCSIYTTRPGVCRDYQCRLLKRYVAKAVTFDEARAVIKRTLRISARFRAALEEVMPIDPSLSRSRMFENFRSAFGDGLEAREFQQKYKKVLLSHAKLMFELDAHFWEITEPEQDV